MSRKIKIPTSVSKNDNFVVKRSGISDEDPLLQFTFSDFKMYPINIDKVFNSYFRNQDEYIRKITVLIEKALPLISNEKCSIFSDISKAKTFHLHKLHGKENILKRVFSAYRYSEAAINSFIDGDEIYQLEVPYENGAMRIIFERIGGLISFLFMDPNHHIYMDPSFVEKDHSLFYEYCPVYNTGSCQRMNYLNTCFAFEFLDEQAYMDTYGYNYDPNYHE